MKKRILVYCVIFFITFPYCKKEDNADCKDLKCTDIFMSVTILIKYSADNKPVQLTDYKVVRISDNLDITRHDNNLSDNNGYYTVVNDLTSGLPINSNTKVEFQGFIDDVIVIQRQFTIKRDCCHISLVSGETEAFI